MNRIIKDLPQTLRQHNNSVMLSSAILTGKEFRNLKRKRKTTKSQSVSYLTKYFS